MASLQITPHGQKIGGSTQTGIHALFPKRSEPLVRKATSPESTCHWSFTPARLVTFEKELCELRWMVVCSELPHFKHWNRGPEDRGANYPKTQGPGTRGPRVFRGYVALTCYKTETQLPVTCVGGCLVVQSALLYTQKTFCMPGCAISHYPLASFLLTL